MIKQKKFVIYHTKHVTKRYMETANLHFTLRLGATTLLLGAER